MTQLCVHVFLGQSFVHSNTMRSGSESRTLPGAHNGMIGSGHSTMGGANPSMGGANYSGTMRSQPQSRK